MTTSPKDSSAGATSNAGVGGRSTPTTKSHGELMPTLPKCRICKKNVTYKLSGVCFDCEIMVAEKPKAPSARRGRCPEPPPKIARPSARANDETTRPGISYAAIKKLFEAS